MSPGAEGKPRPTADRSRIRLRTIRRVDELLAGRYGEKRVRAGDPLDGLIRTILSQNTTDKTSLPAFERLKARFPDWEDALAAAPADIEETIRDAGLAPTKSKRIHDLLAQVKAERGALDLSHVCSMEPDEAEAYLNSFKGVGPKTVAIVLLFDCGMPLFPVDTHVFRVTTRLGWLPEGCTPERAHELLREMVPEELHVQLHLNLVQHGRETCHARRPACDECVIRRLCASRAGGTSGNAR